MPELKKHIATPLLILLITANTHAQKIDDWEARPSFTLAYKFSKKWSLAGTYYLYLDRSMSRYDKSVIGGEVMYKVSSWFKTGIEYRYCPDSREINNDLRYYLLVDHDLSEKWNIKFRPMFRVEFTSLEKEHLALEPVEYYLANRLTLGYDISRRAEIYLFTENYQQMEEGSISFHKQRSSLGAEIKTGNRTKVDTRFDITNTSKGKIKARFNVNYSVTLGFLKKK